MKHTYLQSILMVIIYILTSLGATANNISISNVQMGSQNTSAGSGSAENYIQIQFDISWENSFRDSINWDAAWVFVKYKVTGTSVWKHATIATSGYTAPSGSSVAVPSDKRGIFIYRSSNGNGTFAASSAVIQWNYAADSVGDDDTYTIKVMGCEMVYVPTTSYSLGTGGTTESYMFYQYGSGTYPTYSVTSENAITIGTSSGNLYARGAITAATLPAAFPKGYSAFYCMKYEISQGQYLDFLNCLTRSQQNNNVNCTITGDAPSKAYVLSNYATLLNRNYITCPTSGNGTTNPIIFTCAAPTLVCNHISYQQVAAYLDWAGLRLMTELEFEKACRGDQTPVADEYAWGTTAPYANYYYIGSSTTSAEYITNASTISSNAIYITTAGGSSMDGIARCGVFATSSSTRTTSGASYYGIMELSGSIWERVVNVSSSTGRAFTGTHGDGSISSSGYATNSDWPGYSSGQVSGGTGSGYRGGSMSYGTSRMYVSDRNWIASTDYAKHQGRGGRGVRIAP
jgi:formylglycine-generating enzyme required for sulfatase activity